MEKNDVSATKKTASMVLLIVIYLAFVSLGLPDGLLGVAWPNMREYYQMPLSSAGYVSIISTIGSCIMSFMSGHIIRRFGTGKIVVVSGFLTSVAMFGFGISQNFLFLLLLSFPFGLGAGGVDAALNGYVANHYSARHMNWLHGFWGCGAFVGPLLMTWALVQLSSWRIGYYIVASIQLILAIVFVITLPLWAKNEAPSAKPSEVTEKSEQPDQAPASDNSVRKENSEKDKNRSPFRTYRKALILSMLIFLFYTGMEAGVGLWSASFLRELRGFSVSAAGFYVSVYYFCIMLGRFLTGVIVNKVGTVRVIRIGSVIALLGFVCFISPYFASMLSPVGMALIGFGFAPMYPCTMQDTPLHFDASFSSIAIGYQMGSANFGYTILPFFLAKIAEATTLYVIPVGCAIFLFGFIASSLLLTRKKRSP